MNEKDQRLYRIAKTDNISPAIVVEGGREISRVMIIPILSYSIICDYMGTKDPNAVSSSSIEKLNKIFLGAYIDRQSMDGYSVCGLTVKECINESTRPEVI